MKKLNLDRLATSATLLDTDQQLEIKGGVSTIHIGRRQVKFSKWGEIDIRYTANGVAIPLTQNNDFDESAA